MTVDDLAKEVGEKAKFYVAMGKILTNNDSPECLEYANKFSSAVDALVDKLQKVNVRLF